MLFVLIAWACGSAADAPPPPPPPAQPAGVLTYLPPVNGQQILVTATSHNEWRVEGPKPVSQVGDGEESWTFLVTETRAGAITGARLALTGLKLADSVDGAPAVDRTPAVVGHEYFARFGEGTMVITGADGKPAPEKEAAEAADLCRAVLEGDAWSKALAASPLSLGASVQLPSSFLAALMGYAPEEVQISEAKGTLTEFRVDPSGPQVGVVTVDFKAQVPASSTGLAMTGEILVLAESGDLRGYTLSGPLNIAVAGPPPSTATGRVDIKVLHTVQH